jgi:valine--pyruvate aminotransferase
VSELDQRTRAVPLSRIGERMAGMSGLRSIMEDIAVSTAGPDAAEWLNLSIGNPAPIPEVIGMWRRFTEHALATDFATASCRYGPSRGAPVLVDAIVEYFTARYGWDIGPENVVIGPGSQMLCFIAAALYAGPAVSGTPRLVLPMVPDYTGYHGLCMDPDGITGVEAIVREDGPRSFHYAFDFDAIDQRDDLGVLLLSSPSNPTGRCVTPEELASLIATARRHDALLLLDHAYGEPFPRIGRTLAPPPYDPNVVNCFSFSKAGLPGERIGFAIGPRERVTPMVSFLANSALHASRLMQSAIAACLRSGELDVMTSSVIAPFYARRRALAERLLAKHMPSDVAWRSHAAEGGMFAWVWIDEDWFDDLELYRLLKRHHVFVAPGRSFFTNLPPRGAHSTRCFRITLTVDEGVLTEGVSRIAAAVAELRTSARMNRSLRPCLPLNTSI